MECNMNDSKDIPFTEDQWWRVVNNLHCTMHSLKYLEEFYPRIDDDERERMVKAIEEFEQFSYKLYDKFGDQFHHHPDARSVCPNPDCHNIYAYFFEDWKYCPKCGTKLIFTYCDKEGE